MITPNCIERDFPTLRTKTYLNTAAEGIPPLSVGIALEEYWQDKLRGMDGREAHFRREKQLREIAGRFFHLSASEIGFCSCSAEAYNLLASALNLENADEVVLTNLDFPSGATPWLTGMDPPQVKLWKARDGRLELEDLTSLLSERTRLVQVSLVSFYNGFRLDWLPFLAQVRASAPLAVVSVDVTQALGRCVFDCSGADIIISSTHKWILGIHGGCVVGIPEQSAARLTTRAGGWYHLRNAFESDRFERAEIKPGAASYSVGMPSFAPIYALHAGMTYIEEAGVAAIAAHADSLTRFAYECIRELGLRPLAPYEVENSSGIVAFTHPMSEQIQACLHREDIHVMHHAGRIRFSMHGYNIRKDVEHFASGMRRVLAAL